MSKKEGWGGGPHPGADINLVGQQRKRDDGSFVHYFCRGSSPQLSLGTLSHPSPVFSPWQVVSCLQWDAFMATERTGRARRVRQTREQRDRIVCAIASTNPVVLLVEPPPQVYATTVVFRACGYKKRVPQWRGFRGIEMDPIYRPNATFFFR
jgi:hypothetical protein